MIDHNIGIPDPPWRHQPHPVNYDAKTYDAVEAGRMVIVPVQTSPPGADPVGESDNDVAVESSDVKHPVANPDPGNPVENPDPGIQAPHPGIQPPQPIFDENDLPLISFSVPTTPDKHHTNEYDVDEDDHIGGFADGTGRGFAYMDVVQSAPASPVKRSCDEYRDGACGEGREEIGLAPGFCLEAGRVGIGPTGETRNG